MLRDVVEGGGEGVSNLLSAKSSIRCPIGFTFLWSPFSFPLSLFPSFPLSLSPSLPLSLSLGHWQLAFLSLLVQSQSGDDLQYFSLTSGGTIWRLVSGWARTTPNSLFSFTYIGYPFTSSRDLATPSGVCYPAPPPLVPKLIMKQLSRSAEEFIPSLFLLSHLIRDVQTIR